MLEAANNDPLRAKEIEKKIDLIWWLRYKAQREGQARRKPDNAE
jgi:hypothetical protein